MAALGRVDGQGRAALVDGGNPTSQAKTVDGTGRVSDAGGDFVTGYSIISADSLDAALELAKTCPIFLGPNPAKVDVYETFQAM